jgi:hypothetical protein
MLCFSSSSSTKRRPRRAFFRGPKDGSRRVLNRDCKENEGLIHLPVWPNPSDSLFFYFNVCTYRCELIVTPCLLEFRQQVTFALPGDVSRHFTRRSLYLEFGSPTPDLASRLRMSESVPTLLLYAFIACTGTAVPVVRAHV